MSAVPAPGGYQGFKVQVSNKGGRRPRWSGNRHDLLYQQGDQMMARGLHGQGRYFRTGKGNACGSPS